MKYLIILFLSSILFISCSDELITNYSSFDDATTGVLSIKEYTLGSEMISVEDYEYSNQGKLSKKSYYGGNRETIYYYEQFFYNSDGTLKYKIKYNSNIYSPTGFITLDSTVLNYSNGLLTSKKILYPQANTFDEVKYEYEGTQLKIEKYYYNGSYTEKIIYEYNNGRIQNKLQYNNQDKLYGFLKYSYEGNCLTRMEQYTPDNELVTSTNFSYNKDKIVKETFEVIAMYLSVSSHIATYEY